MCADCDTQVVKQRLGECSTAVVGNLGSGTQTEAHGDGDGDGVG